MRKIRQAGKILSFSGFLHDVLLHFLVHRLLNQLTSILFSFPFIWQRICQAPPCPPLAFLNILRRWFQNVPVQFCFIHFFHINFSLVCFCLSSCICLLVGSFVCLSAYLCLCICVYVYICLLIWLSVLLYTSVYLSVPTARCL